MSPKASRMRAAGLGRSVDERRSSSAPMWCWLGHLIVMAFAVAVAASPAGNVSELGVASCAGAGLCATGIGCTVGSGLLVGGVAAVATGG